MTTPLHAIKGQTGTAGLGERLKCVREIRRLTQAELADKLNVKPAQVSHWETGNQLPSVVHLRNLCLWLNCSADYLLDSNL